jgi:hypothetical protein
MKTTPDSTPDTSSGQPGPILADYHEIGTLKVLRDGIKQEVEGLVKLELTAEEMLRDEARLAETYIRDDASHFWQDFKEGLISWELTAGELLLSAADPTRVEWQREHWWGDDEAQFH